MKSKQEPIAVVGASISEVVNLLPFARVLARSRRAPELIIGLVSVPQGETLSAGARAAQKFRRALQKQVNHSDIRITVKVSYDVWQEARNTLARESCQLVVLNAANMPSADFLRDLPCDAVIASGTLPDHIERILLPIRGGPHAALSLQVALAYAQSYHAQITLLHATPSPRFRDLELRELLSHLHAVPEITSWQRGGND